LKFVVYHLLFSLALIFLLAACEAGEAPATAVPPTRTLAPTRPHQQAPVNTAAPTITATQPPSPTAVPTDQPLATATPIPTASHTPTPLPRDVRAALQLIADGFVSPVALAAPDDGSGRLFIVDQIGVVYVLDASGSRLRDPLIDLRANMVDLIETYDERGLLGIALHPDFAANGRLYLYYSAPLRPNAPADWDHTGIIAQFTIAADNPNRADPASEQIIIEIDQPQNNHNGGQLAFGPDGYLYIGIGDGGNANDVGLGHSPQGNGQDRDNLLGKILRLDVDSAIPYSIPADNPFVGQPGLPEIYAYGFRNPYRFSFDAGGDHWLIAGDVGQDYMEEIDVVVSGGNYGWPVREGTTCFNKGGVTSPLPECATQSAYGDDFLEPVLEYRREFGRSVTGGYVYRGRALPELYGRYLFVDWVTNNETGGRKIYYADLQPPGSGLWELVTVPLTQADGGELPGFYSLSFGEDTARELYLLTADYYQPVGSSGKVYKIVPTP
jgi:glucose/arabinose dehydrogenase